MFERMVQIHKHDKKLGSVTASTFWISIPLLILTVIQLTNCVMIMTGNPPRVQQLGIKTYIGTISIQEVFLLCLFGMVVRFYSTMSTNTQRLDNTWHQWHFISIGLFLSLGAISLRIFYRIIELSQVFQANAKLAHNEVFFYSFEAVPVFVALSVWTVVNMGDLTESVRTDDDYQQIHEPGSQEHIPLSTPQNQV